MGTPGSMALAASSWSIAVEGNSTPTAARFSSNCRSVRAPRRTMGASARDRTHASATCAEVRPDARRDSADFRGDRLSVGAESRMLVRQPARLLGRRCGVLSRQEAPAETRPRHRRKPEMLGHRQEVSLGAALGGASTRPGSSRTGSMRCSRRRRWQATRPRPACSRLRCAGHGLRALHRPAARINAGTGV